MPKVFISYRREHTLAIAGRIDDRLQAAYGRPSVFRDISTIPPGVDFRQHISDAVSQCEALIALIGTQWLEASQGGLKRLDDPSDFVRIEIEAALTRGVPVVPVLVDGAAMPLEKDLPPSLSALAYRNAVKVDSGVDFHQHMDRLVRGLDKVCGPAKKKDPAEERKSNADKSPRSIEQSQASQVDNVPTNRPVSTDGQTNRFLPVQEKGSEPAPFQPPKLSVGRGIVLTGLAVILNSVLAALGSVLWGHFPYWPGFMVSALVCGYYRFWGVWVAMLTPIAPTFLLTGGRAPHLYPFVDLLQALLIIGAFHKFRIDPRLPSWTDRFKYLGLVVAAPSFLGGCSAWLVRRLTDPGSGDFALPVYALVWTAENLLPAIFPGIWLHRVVGEFYRPFSWGSGGRVRSWMRQTFEYATPWIITLLVAGCLVIFMVTKQIGAVTGRSVIWKRVYEIAAESVVFRGMILAMSISLLVSLGYAIRHAKQASLLEEAVRRHLPTQQEAERILSGKTTPSERHLATSVCISIRMFTKQLAQFPPAELVTWLNSYFDRVYSSCSRNNGCIDKYTGDGMLLAFGLKGGGTHAIDAIRCSLDIIEELQSLNGELDQKHLPQISIGMGIHTGLVITGEFGSRDQRQYMVVGESVYIASDTEQKTKELSADFLPVLISHDTVEEAGLLLDTRLDDGFVPISVGNPDAEQPHFLYAIRDSAVVRAMLIESTTCKLDGSSQ